MIYAFDTYYTENTARTACVAFEKWDSPIPFATYHTITTEISDYESGQFYKRELPCILEAIEKINLAEGDLILVDGFVHLDDDGKKGLGGYLYDALDQKTPIIGVAKNNFATLDQLKRPILRGESKKPLYITAIGYDLDQAATAVQSMAGDFRMPDLLKLVDQESRG